MLEDVRICRKTCLSVKHTFELYRLCLYQKANVGFFLEFLFVRDWTIVIQRLSVSIKYLPFVFLAGELLYFILQTIH